MPLFEAPALRWARALRASVVPSAAGFGVSSRLARPVVPALIALAVVAAALGALASPAAADPVEFRYDPPGKPKAVYLAGDFNNWNPTGRRLTDDDGDGVFTVTVDLPAGSYQYKFVVDGDWVEDPRSDDYADDGFGGKNSVLRVGGSGDQGGFVGSGAAAGGGKATAGKAEGKAAGGAGGSAPAGDATFTFTQGGKHSEVFVAGSFNDWSVGANPMRDDDGDGTWTATVNLAEGRYEYKFVADGTWITDESAAEFNDDGFGGKNSVIVVGDAGGGAAGGAASGGAKKVAARAKPAAGAAAAGVPAGKVTFSFTPGSKPGELWLAGSFNDWSVGSTALIDPDGDGTYTARLDLAEGRYEYKFVADGTWITDESAAEFNDDGFGGKNSVIVVGGAGGAASGQAAGGAVAGGGTPAGTGGAPSGTAKPSGAAVDVEFSYQPVISGVSSVHLVGEFNGWDTSATPMKDEDGDGTYTVTIPLAPGSYQYKFLIDGSTWLEDPNAEDSADDGYGGQNSLVEIGMKGGSDSPKPRFVKFGYKPSAKPNEISLAGTFNNWTVGKTPMTDPDGDGTYEVTLLLPEGDYQYKFVADGSWIADETAARFADDGFGGQNSIVVVDDTFPAVTLARGDGKIFADGISHRQTVREVNWVSDTEVQFTAKAYAGDVEKIEVEILNDDRSKRGDIVPMGPIGSDATFEYYGGTYRTVEPIEEFRYAVRYEDGGETWYAKRHGLVYIDQDGHGPDVDFLFSEATIRRFTTPDWVRDGVFYQIFPERFANGDKSNDPDFSQEYYDGRRKLPASGKKNGEYYHLVKDWDDIAGLSRSPYRTDGKPDYFSFYGGDIAGIRENLDYLEDLGVTILYFNPLFQARSNHKYEAYDYQSIDPAFGTEEEFRAFVDEAHSRGIRIVVDWVINHIGDHSPYFQDTVRNGEKSKYWNWFEWKKWPLPAFEPSDWREYYECWWGFAHMPDLNYDLSRANANENGVKNPEDAEVNRPVVDYVLDSATYWVEKMDVDGFRLDVPNEVPFWVWKIFREHVQALKPDVYLVGEIWSDAGDWISPDCFDATMNYKYFKDPVTNFVGKGVWNAKKFDREIAAGRLAYPMQATRVMMNLVGSHDTPRYLNAIGNDLGRARLTTLFAMTYVGVPHIYYGDEIAMRGGADPDCRRPFRWNWKSDPERVAMHDWVRDLIRLRRDHPALVTGEFETLFAEGTVHSFARWDGDAVFVVALNAGDRSVDVELDVRSIDGAANASFESVAGEPAGNRAKNGSLSLSLPPVSGTVLRLVRSS